MNSIAQEVIPARSAASEFNSPISNQKKVAAEASEITVRPQSVSILEPTVLSINIPVTTNIEQVVYIGNEEFTLKVEDEKYYIDHNLWSLAGEGNSLLDAELDLINQAKEIYELIKDDPISDLSLEAIRMRDFIYGLI